MCAIRSKLNVLIPRFRFLCIVISAILASSPLLKIQAEEAKSIILAEEILWVPSEDYRLNWTLLGAVSTTAEKPEEGAGQIHNTYAKTEDVIAYRKNGVFLDGAVLIKDVMLTKTEDLTTGKASYADRFYGRFVMVKDSKGELGSSGRFGEGWGWAFYEGDETRNTVTMDYATACLACHEPVRKQDFLHIRMYPVLSP